MTKRTYIKNICEKSFCTGCGACYSSCPKGAISMQVSSEGFLYPVIDSEKCISCNLCKNICPANVEINKKEHKPNVFAIMGNDVLRMESSSGGVFSLVAEYFFKNNGYVCGAIFNSENSKVEHILTNNINDLPRLRKSKYVQSDLKNCFGEIKNILNNDKLVLFIGTPCQVAGLRAYLRKDYPNLYCIDILCHSVPSPKLLDKFIESLNVDKDEKVLDINFRTKKYGWKPQYTTLIVTNKQNLEIAPFDNIYYKAFFNGLASRESCSTCKYANWNRMGDLTLGDFWWIEKYKQNYNDGLGTSLVLENTKKGKILLNKIKQNCKLLKKVPRTKVTNLNLKQPSKVHNNRKRFFEQLDDINLQDNINFCIEDKFDIGIINMWWAISNYGALLTGYAIQQILKQMGYSSKLINNISMCPDQEKEYKNTFNYRFAQEYLNYTEILRTPTDFELLNNQAKIFITGSDQVFAPKWMNSQIDYYLLNFVNTENKKISFSASFGVDKNEYETIYDKKTIQKVKLALKTFDYISTREKSGLELCDKLMDVNADWIIDPVFILDKKYFEKIAQKSKTNYTDKIVSYVLDSNPDFEKLYLKLSNKYTVEVVKLYGTDCNVEEFLNAIKNCKYFITDSFHGVCFAIIFNKMYSAIVNQSRGATRFDSLNDLFNIYDNVYSSITDLLNSDLEFYHNDYNKINDIIRIQQKIALETLNKCLKTEKNLENIKLANYYNLIKFNQAILEETMTLKKRINTYLKMIYHFLPKFAQKLILFFIKK